MKKIIITSILIIMIAMVAIVPVSAQKDKINIKGELTAIDSSSLTIETKKGIIYTVEIPEEFDIPPLEVGDSVLIKAIAGEEDNWVATVVKQVGPGSEDGDLGDDNEGFQEHSAYCADGKQERPHPLAPKIAERFDVSEEMVMSYYCDGYSIGAIMLAIKTSQLEGVGATLDDLLTDRASGYAWGLIWKDLGLIGSEKNGNSPPGLLKKPDKIKPENGD
jgi:hypothetical protein